MRNQRTLRVAAACLFALIGGRLAHGAFIDFPGTLDAVVPDAVAVGPVLSDGPSVVADTRYQAHDESTTHRTLHFAAGDDRTLAVRLVSGSIRVSGSDDGAVEIDVRRTVR